MRSASYFGIPRFSEISRETNTEPRGYHLTTCLNIRREIPLLLFLSPNVHALQHYLVQVASDDNVIYGRHHHSDEVRVDGRRIVGI